MPIFIIPTNPKYDTLWQGDNPQGFMVNFMSIFQMLREYLYKAKNRQTSTL